MSVKIHTSEKVKSDILKNSLNIHDFGKDNADFFKLFILSRLINFQNAEYSTSEKKNILNKTRNKFEYPNRA